METNMPPSAKRPSVASSQMPSAYATIAEVYMKRLTSAVQDYGEALAKAAAAYRQAGKTDEADKAAKQLKDRYPNFAGG